MIEISSLTVRFGGVTPVDEMTLAFGVGTIGLIGPNGAGKTTMYNDVSRIYQPTTGRVTFEGRNLLDDLVRGAAAAGATVLVASHELDRAEPLAHRSIHLAGGRVEAVVPC